MSEKLIPVYTSKGDAEAFLAYPYLFNRSGEWIGFVTPRREIYSVFGEYVGMLTNDPRIVRKRSLETLPPRITPPAPPQKMSAPANVPLSPMMSDLSHSDIDVLLDEPERLHTLDAGGEFREDMN
jgi:hypothetical protein